MPDSCSKNSKVKFNVLVFPGGMENGLEIYSSLRHCKEIKIFSASASIQNHAEFVYHDNFLVRDVRTDGWINDINEVVSKNKIDLIFPANSMVIDYLVENRTKINAPVLLPDSSVVKLTRSKKQTLEFLKDVVLIPKVYKTINEVENFPVFSKPDQGYGSQGAEIVADEQHLKKIDFNKNIIQEFLSGKEYTVDCFSNHKAQLLFCGGRERSRIRMATSMHAEPVSKHLEARFSEIATAIQSKLKISGVWFFQVKEDGAGNLKLLEVDIRVAGTMCYNRCRGVNFSLLSIFDFFKYDVSILTNPQPLTLDRCLKNRYKFEYEYNTVYIDLDDTIVVHGKINVEVVQFLFQCINKNIKLILISKCNETDKDAYLKKMKLFNLFDEIFWLGEEELKSAYIQDLNSIFIDDSFSQRKEVSERWKIPVFDTSMIEALLDDRY